MTETSKKLFVVVTRGLDSEVSSVALTIANGGITSGLSVDLFLTSNGVDLARKRAADLTHLQPCEPLRQLRQESRLRAGGPDRWDGDRGSQRDAQCHQGGCCHALLLSQVRNVEEALPSESRARALGLTKE
jgi:peroxiredoxin family protein